jgi:hypothetical protein
VCVLALVATLLPALSSWAQTPPPAGEATPAEEPTPERPGLFRVGSLYLTPYLHIGALGIDTNVFYSPTERQADFTASGGPGLEVVRPFGRASRLRLDGGLDYLYFAKTESQRKLNGYGTALLQLEGVKTMLVVEERYARTFSRPSFEVDARVQQETEGTQAFLRRNLGERFRLALSGGRQRTQTDSQEYLGTDLGETLTSDLYVAGAELRLALSVKTQLVGGGERSFYRFPRLPERDGASTLAYGGLRTDETALVSGQALAGVRWFGLDADTEARRDVVYASVDATVNLSPKTKLGGRYVRDADYSAFATSGATPTNLTETAEVFFDKVLASNVYLHLFARQRRLVSDGEVTIAPPDEPAVTAVRDDRVREAGAELGYQFRTRVRIGLTAVYTERKSSFETFGIEGLLAGLTVQYNPPQPRFR